MNQQDPLRRNPPSAQRGPLSRRGAWWVTRRATITVPDRSEVGAANLRGPT